MSLPVPPLRPWGVGHGHTTVVRSASIAQTSTLLPAPQGRVVGPNAPTGASPDPLRKRRSLAQPSPCASGGARTPAGGVVNVRDSMGPGQSDVTIRAPLLTHVTGWPFRYVSWLFFMSSMEMSLLLVSPVAGSILISLPSIDWEAGMSIPLPLNTWFVTLSRVPSDLAIAARMACTAATP